MAALAAGGHGLEGETSTPRVAVVGGGISGLSCASALSQFGYNVWLFDMGKSAPGGRMTTRRTAWKGLQFDHGCQFFSARSADLKAAAEDWVAAGVAARWEGRIGELCVSTGKFTPRSEAASSSGGGGDAASSSSSSGEPGSSGEGFQGVMRPGPLYVGVPSKDALCAHLATHGGIGVVRSDVQVQKAELGADGTWLLEGTIRQPKRTMAERKQDPPYTPWNLGAYDALVLADKMTATPGAPGFVRLLGSPAAAKLAASLGGVGSVPCLALMLGFEGAAAPVLPFDAATVAGSDSISWVCLDSAKPGRVRTDGAQCVVALATPNLSARLCPRGPDGRLQPQTPELLAQLAPVLHAALCEALAAAGVRLPDPAFIQAHRWGSAFPAKPLDATCLRADAARLAACGDFCAGGGVEGAVVSGRAAADAIRTLFES